MQSTYNITTTTTTTTTPDTMTPNPKRKSKANEIRRMIKKGYSTRDIARKLNVSRQYVYSTRYFMNRNKNMNRGLGSIGKEVPAPTEGINAPRQAVPVQETPQVATPRPSLWSRILNWFRC